MKFIQGSIMKFTHTHTHTHTHTQTSHPPTHPPTNTHTELYQWMVLWIGTLALKNGLTIKCIIYYQQRANQTNLILLSFFYFSFVDVIHYARVFNLIVIEEIKLIIKIIKNNIPGIENQIPILIGMVEESFSFLKNNRLLSQFTTKNEKWSRYL